MKVAVLGHSPLNIAPTVAADLALRGLEVAWWPAPAAVRQTGHIEVRQGQWLDAACSGHAPVSTPDHAADLLSHADAVIVDIPMDKLVQEMSLVVAHYGVDRLGFPVGALFAVVASQWVVGEALPPRAPPTIADWLHVTSFGVILVVTLVNVRSLLVLENGDPEKSKSIDRFWFRTIAPTWVALCVLICVMA